MPAKLNCICGYLETLFLRADNANAFATITACGFYEKMGYGYPTGTRMIDEKGKYPMIKVRNRHY